MKFKSVFLLFNIAVGVSFLFVFAMPFLALGGEYAFTFWKSNWPLAAALLLVLGALDGFFAYNWRLFTLLEREDWPALAHYLDERVVRGGRWNGRLVRLLANTYLVLSDADGVIELEGKAASAKPSLVRSNALVFGVARVLKNDPPAAVAFFAERRNAAKGKDDWIEWYYAFSLLLDKRFEEAADVLLPLAQSAKDAIVAALCSSFLVNAVAKSVPSRREEAERAAAAAADRVRKKFPTEAAWAKEVEKARADIYVVVLGKSIEDAGRQLYS